MLCDLSLISIGIWFAQEWEIFSWESWINVEVLKPKRYQRAWCTESSLMHWRGQRTRILAPMLLFIWINLFAILFQWEWRISFREPDTYNQTSDWNPLIVTGLKRNNHMHLMYHSKSIKLLGKQHGVYSFLYIFKLCWGISLITEKHL